MTTKQRDLLKNMVDNMYRLQQNTMHEFLAAAPLQAREACATLSQIDGLLCSIECDIQDIDDLLDAVEVDDVV